ncbi:MAG: AAA family ATPase, partial [Longimicrobiales bacterium]|nr:AAA family ATPase [Longimicrobiales bacterium]
LALALATGTPFLGRFAVPGHRRVGLVLMEDAAFRVRRRIERILGGLGLSMADVEGRLFLWFRPPLRLTDQTVVELGDYAAELDLDFLGVDSWAYVASGDSNSADEVTPQLQALSALKTRRPGLTVGLAHHAAKGRDEAGTEMRLTDIIRNSGAFGAWYDVGVVLSRRNETSPVTVRMEMRDQPAPDPFAFTVEDEYAASPQNNLRSSGWLRLEASDEAPQTLERRVAAERLVPAVREFLRDQDGWVSGNKLREGVGGRAQDVDAALNLLVKAGNAEFIPSPGRGKAALSRYLVPPRPNLVPDDVLDRPSPPRPVPVRDEVGGVSTPPPGPQTSSVRDEVAAILEGAW